jgi:hypothetical protein
MKKKKARQATQKNKKQAFVQTKIVKPVSRQNRFEQVFKDYVWPIIKIAISHFIHFL